MTQALKIQKLVSFSLAFLLVALLQPMVLVDTFIVLGQGHFLICYLYQYKAGKITGQYIATYIPLSLALFCAVFYLKPGLELEFIVAVYFLLHFLFDEIALFGDRPSFLTSLESAPIFLLFIGHFLHYMFYVDMVYFVWPSAVLIVLALVISMVRRCEIPPVSQYFLSAATVLLSLFLVGYKPEHIAVLFGFIALVHYINFYIHHFFKVCGDEARKREYLSIVLGINAIIVSCFVVYRYFGVAETFFDLWFQRQNFWVWTILHIFFTTRLNDYRHAVQFRTA